MIIAMESDKHAGHEQGLSYPELVDVDGEREPYQISATQRRLYEIRENNLKLLKMKRGRGRKKKKLVFIEGGDQTQGNKYYDSVAEVNMSRQQKIAYTNMLPVLELEPDYLRICKGTRSHEFGDGGAAVILDNYYRMKFPKLNIKTVDHGLFNIDGFRIDYKHHGPNGGAREWTKSNPPLNYLKSTMWQEFTNGRTPANLYVRAHIHVERWVTWHEKFRGVWYTSHLVTLPSMCGVGAYELQAVRNLTYITNGMVLFDTDLQQAYFWTDTLDLRVEEVV